MKVLHELDFDFFHWQKSWWGLWGLSPTSEGGEQFRRKTLTVEIKLS